MPYMSLVLGAKNRIKRAPLFAATQHNEQRRVTLAFCLGIVFASTMCAVLFSSVSCLFLAGKDSPSETAVQNQSFSDVEGLASLLQKRRRENRKMLSPPGVETRTISPEKNVPRDKSAFF